MTDSKPHLPYDLQLERMVSRGLSYSSRPQAMLALRRIGYYRLSAYTYPFRAPMVEDAAGPSKRSDNFVANSTLEDALHLYSFDEKLRMVLLEGLHAIEVALSVRIGYVLGKRDPLAHLDPNLLDPVSCAESKVVRSASQERTEITAHEMWLARYEKLKHDAREEEYVKHHILHYGGNVPIWVATEFMDFGCLIRLLKLMLPSDQKKIAEEMGLSRDNKGQTLHRWLVALNILRNHCSHSNRVWNRSTVEQPPSFSTHVVELRLHHLNGIENSRRQKLYYLASLIAYLVVEVNPTTNWPRTFKTQAKKLGNVGGMTLENTMGFPDDWDALAVWNYQPIAL